MLTWGIFIGALVFFGSLREIARRKPKWMYRWFRPWGGAKALNSGSDSGFLWRVKLALSPWNHLYSLPLIAPLFGMGIATLLISTTGAKVDLFLGCMIGYGAATALAYPIDLTKSLAKYREQIAIFAAQKLARRLPPAVSNDILVPLTQSQNPTLRIAAAMGLRELGTKDGGLALAGLTQDPDERVALTARNAYADLNGVYQGKNLLSVRTMETYAAEHAYLLQRVRRGDRKSRQPFEEKLDEITRQIDEIIFSQLPIRRSFPDVFCMDCFARGEQQRYEEWDWIRCRQCKEVHALQPGVKSVVGQIGGAEGWELKDGTLRVNLWDESNRKAKPADLNVLEVIGGSPINYDWAVSAVVDKMHNASLHVGTRIAVKLTGEPPLEANSLQLLKTLDQSMIIAGPQPRF